MKHFTYIFLLAFTVLVVGCSDNELEFSENYDIPLILFQVPELQSVRKSVLSCRNRQPALLL